MGKLELGIIFSNDTVKRTKPLQENTGNSFQKYYSVLEIFEIKETQHLASKLWGAICNILCLI